MHSSGNNLSDAPDGKKSLVRRLAASTTIVTVILTLVVAGATVLRLRTEAKNACLKKAKITLTEVMQRLAVLPESDYEAAVTGIGEEKNVRVTLIDANEENALGLSPSRVAELSGGQAELTTIDGEVFGIAAAAASELKSERYVAVLAGRPSVTAAFFASSFRLGFLALLAAMAAVLFGASMGLTLSDHLTLLCNRLGSMDAPKANRSRISVVPAPEEEMSEFDAAFGRVEENFIGELAMYKDAIDEIQILDAQRTEFLGDLSADLHTPIVKILDHARQLSEGEDGPLQESQSDDVRIISTAGHRLKHLVEEVLDLSALINHGIEYDTDPVDMEAVVKEVVEQVEGALGKKDIELRMEVEKGARTNVRGSRQRLWQVLTNLVSNAVKFTEAGEVVVSLVRVDGERVRVDVADTGIGIPDIDHRDIFNPFRQRGEISKKLKGTGLGLAICRRLTELHRGEISVDSRKEEGSTFTVVLPSA